MRMSKEILHQRAFTLVETMVVVSLIGLLAAIAIPGYARSRAQAAETTCIQNLRQIESAKRQWAMESRKGQGAKPKAAELFGPSGYIRAKPECPAGGEYEINKIKDCATCTIPGHKLD